MRKWSEKYSMENIGEHEVNKAAYMTEFLKQ